MLKKMIYRLVISLPDDIATKILFYINMRRKIRTEETLFFSDKINLLKLSGGLSKYSSYVDKLEVREYVKDKIKIDITPKLYDVYERSTDFDFDALPNKFVMKLNNGSGCNLVVTNKDSYDSKFYELKIKEWLTFDYYKLTKEIQYKSIVQKVFCEELIEFEGELKDYKVYCIDGGVEFIQVISSNQGKTFHNYYNECWEEMPIKHFKYERGVSETSPSNLNLLLEYARKLSSDFNFVRVDFYVNNDDVIFSELTFTPNSGFIKFYPESFDVNLASKIRLY